MTAGSKVVSYPFSSGRMTPAPQHNRYDSILRPSPSQTFQPAAIAGLDEWQILPITLKCRRTSVCSVIVQALLPGVLGFG